MFIKKIQLKPETGRLLVNFIRVLFLSGFGLLVIFSFLEAVKPRLVLNYINLDVFLLLVIIFGALTAIFYQPEAATKIKLKFWGGLTLRLIAIIIGLGIIYLTKSLGYLSLLVGLAGMIIIYYLIILCLEE